MKDTDTKPFFDIAERIRWHRAYLGLDQKDYAAEAGLKRAQLSNWEGGTHRIGIDAALALRATYGLSLDFIYTGDTGSLPMSLITAWQDHEKATRTG